MTLQTTKLWLQTIKKLKIIASHNLTTMVAIADELANKELVKLGYDINELDSKVDELINNKYSVTVVE